MTGLVWLAAALALLPLVLITAMLLVRGGQALSWAFFTELPRPVGVAGGGVANAIAGTGVLVLLAALIGLPVGIGAGLYLAQHPRTTLARLSRYLSDVLNGLPSIVLGVFAWELVVRPTGHFSAAAGGLALGVMLIPLVARATEEMVRLVPVELGEAALALGFPRWRTALAVVLRTALPGIVTAALVAVARVAGETAPLLFTAFGNAFWSVQIDEPIAALPLSIYAYAGSPYEQWHTLAWGGALVLLLLIVLLSAAARLATGRRGGRGDGAR